uniref:ATP synthase F0 subunit 8 n=1 Tax=Amblyomma testudinarium TaxID=375577 RepID=A0A6M3RNS0_AMBTS|nr:ATP synthase F0 subunit 8 [Amblyomma testudinarium]
MPQLFPMNWMMITLLTLNSILILNIFIFFLKLDFSISQFKFKNNLKKIFFKW